MNRVEFWFEFASTYSYPAAMRITGAAAGALAAAESLEAKAKLRARTERAQALGIFGAPSFAVGDELFWGNDRLEAALAWARRD